MTEGHRLSQISARELATPRRRSLGFVIQDFTLSMASTTLDAVPTQTEPDHLPTLVAVCGALTAGGNRTRFSNRAIFG